MRQPKLVSDVGDVVATAPHAMNHHKQVHAKLGPAECTVLLFALAAGWQLSGGMEQGGVAGAGWGGWSRVRWLEQGGVAGAGWGGWSRVGWLEQLPVQVAALSWRRRRKQRSTGAPALRLVL
jgi:hypothetical protein